MCKNFKKFDIPGLMLFEPSIFHDERGFFFEAFNQKNFELAIGENVSFVQDNQSFSKKNTLRGLHLQLEPFAQGKLVRVLYGEIFDVAIDLRKNSQTFGKYASVIISSENKKQFWIPSGFAHGFLVLSDYAEVFYKTTDFYNKDSEKTLLWSDNDLGISWPGNKDNFIISDKDQSGSALRLFKEEL